MDSKRYLTSLTLLGLCACCSNVEFCESSDSADVRSYPVSSLAIPGVAEKYAVLPPGGRVFALDKNIAGGLPSPLDNLLVSLAKQFPADKIKITYSSAAGIVDRWNLYAAEKIFSGEKFDCAAARKEFIRQRYGSAAEEINQYFRLLERRITAAGALSGIGRPSVPKLCDIYDRDFLDELTAVLKRAAAAENNPEIVREIGFVAAKQRVILAGIEADVKKLYANSGECSSFTTLYGDPADVETTLELGADDYALRLILTAYEAAAPEKRISQVRPRDFADMWAEDGFEIFLVPDPATPNKGWQFIVNSRGSLWDARHTRVGACDPSWSAVNAQVQFSELKNSWQIVLTVPWKDLGFSGRPPAPFLANVYRNRAVRGESRSSYAWSPIYPGAYYQPEKFGKFFWQGEKK